VPRKPKLPEGIRERGGAYYADFYAGGRRVRKRLSRQLKVAVQLLHELQARADRADFGLLDNDYPLKDLREQYLKHCRQLLRPSSVSRYEGCLNNILPRLSATRAAQVRVDAVLSYRQERLDEGTSPCTVNKEVGALSTMLRWGADKKRQLIGSNPLDGLKPLPHENPKEGRALSGDEVARLLERSPQPWRDVWYAFLVTGVRKDELATLTFRDIDWEAREIIVRTHRTKGKRERRIPIDAGLWEILCRQRDGRQERKPGSGRTAKITARVRERFTTEHVFVTTQNTPLTHRSGIYAAFMRCCKRAGIQVKTLDAEGNLLEHVDVHSLRRTFTTSLIANGADPKSVQDLLGHSTLEMTMRVYTKIHGQTKRQAIGRLPYGRGSLAPEGVLAYPANAPGGDGNSVQFGHQPVTRPATATGS
jgi:integrase